MKMWEGKGRMSFLDSPELDTNKNRLSDGEIKIQCFAIFIPPEVKSDEKFQAALDQIHYFYTEVLGKHSEMKQIKDWEDIQLLAPGEIGIMLTLEGVDPIGNDLHRLHILYQLGVRSVGLTWNYANLAADGAREPRGGGLTLLGEEIVRFHNEHQILTDVSHLSEKAFWDVMDLAEYPIASHSNARALCNHPRNLNDSQSCAMFSKGGMIHVVFCPYFVKKEGTVFISDLIKHIDHFCSLGGVKKIGFGSDFDGIDSYIKGLENASCYQNLINELLKYYSEEQVAGFAHQNFINYVSNIG
jgi:membrane dipeptidase